MNDDLIELLTTTRTVRYGLDFDRPVERRLIRSCLEVARFAPNGANRQGWRFVVLDDPERRAALAPYYRKASEAYLRESGAVDAPDARSARFLAEHIDRAPVLVLACLHGRLPDTAAPARRSSFYGSIYPALWSFMLCARGHRLGTALTTVHLAYEREVAELFGIPYDDVTQVALIVVGHRRHRRARPAPRLPVDDVISHNGWRW